MSRLNLVARGLILSAVLLGNTGCVTWRSQIDPAAGRYDQLASDALRPAEKRLLLTLSVRHPGLNQSTVEQRIRFYRQAGVDFLRDSGYFTEVGTSVTDPDLELVLNISEDQSYADDLAFISAYLTACLIPVYDRIETRALGEVYSSNGEKLREFRIEENVSILLSPLLLRSPFFVVLFPPWPPPPSLYAGSDQAVQDIFRSAIVQMNESEGIWK